MSELTENQVASVQNKLAESRLKYKPLREELLDHLCSGIEENIATGMPFEQAAVTAFRRFEKGEFETIERQTLLSIKSKYFIMKKLPVFTLIVLMFSISVSQALQNDPPGISPIIEGFKITSGYGMRVHPVYKQKKFHRGIDIKAPLGTAIFATSDGVIIEAEDKNDRNGLKIVIKHDEVYQTAYCHLSRIDVKVGQEIKIGDVIGAVGNSGVSTAPHLHYEVLQNGKYIDPEPFMIP